MYRNPVEKNYVKRSVLTAGKTIREALRIAALHAVHSCRKCGRAVAAAEYARSQQAFQRCYCDHCFDEVFLDRRMENQLDYRIGMLEKQKLYQQAGKRLLSLYGHEKPRLRELLRERLGAFMAVPASSGLPSSAP